MRNKYPATPRTKTKTERFPNERLRAQRLKKNWTQVYVATMIGTSDVEVSRWETGAAEPTLYFRDKLCELFRLTSEELGFVTPVEAQQETSEDTFSRWSLPYRRNPLFTGCEEVLARLHTLLHAGKATALVQAQAISGLGGIGKTQTAIEYAYRYRADYSAVLWIKADTRASLFSDTATLAQTLNLPEKKIQDQEQRVAAVLRWLHAHTNWLLILDNIEDFAITEQILSLKTGHVLLTTRTQITGTFAHQIDLQQMTVEEGAVFLLRRAKRLAPDAPLEQASNSDRECAQEIVRVLDGLPLALDQAGAYLEETACSLSDYLDRYSTCRGNLLSRRGGLATDHPESVSASFSLSFEKVECANPTAADLLRFCAFLDPDTIPEEFLTKSTAELGHNLEQLATNPVALDEALAVLRTYSLVRRVPETRTLTIHRLVQAVLRDSMPQEEQRCWAERTVRKIATVVPSSDDVTERAEWERGKRYFLQVLAGLSHIDSWKMQSIEAEQLMHWLGGYFSALGQFTQAEAMFQQALQVGQALLEPEDPLLAEHMNDLAVAYSKQGKLTQAERLEQEALHIRTKAFGSEHSDVATCLNNLGYIYILQGRYAQAEPLLLQALNIWQKVLAPEDLQSAFSLINLGWLYCLTGKYAQAEALNQEGLHIREHNLGENHFMVTYPLMNLGIGYRGQGDYSKADHLFQRALRIGEEALGEEHPSVGQNLYELAQLRVYQNRYDEAASLFQRALARLEQKLVPEHPAIPATYNAYAALLYKTGHHKAARDLYEKGLEIAQLGNNKIHVTAALEGLASVVAVEGEPRWAAQLWGAAESLREELGVPMLPHEHADYERAVAATHTHLSEEAFATAWDEGGRMAPEQALDAQGKPLG